MQEYAPNQTRRTSGSFPASEELATYTDPRSCPSSEELAAYIDGTLGKAESARITEHLASCEDCYAVYMETLHFQLESSAAEPEGVVDAEVRQFRRPSKARPAQEGGALGGSWKSPVRWLPLAALLLVGVGSGGYFQFLAAPRLVITPATPPLASIPQGNQSLWLGPTYRGVGPGEETKLDDASFRMGVQIVNLQATLQAGQVKESQDVIARILNLLKPQPFTDDFQKGYIGITNAVEKRPPADLLPEATRLAKESRDVFDIPSLDLGQWVEAGRLAAMARNPTFFQQPETRKFLRRLRWNDKLGLHEVKLDPTTRESLTRVSQIVANRNLRPADYAALRTELEKILDHLYPQS
jgi:hypothetical protein